MTYETTKRNDLQQHVTDTILAQLEKGTPPWHKPWKGGSPFSLPKNNVTGKAYNGINILLLWSAAEANDYPTQQWATFKQWQDKKESIRKGEKGSLVVYYDILQKEVDGELKEIPFLKSSFVFNRCQLSGYEPEAQNDAVSPETVIKRIQFVETFVSHTQAAIEHEGTRACYIPLQDKIRMPLPQDFIDTASCTATEGYYSTLLHELTHWSGAAHRLDRTKGKKFGDHQYAAEELVAELGAAFLCAEFGLNLLPKNSHASYIASWLKMFKDNKHSIFSAASEASKAVQYLSSLQPA